MSRMLQQTSCPWYLAMNIDKTTRRANKRRKGILNKVHGRRLLELINNSIKNTLKRRK
jgi:hypothetical protein